MSQAEIMPPQVIVAYDFSDASELALQHAVKLAIEGGDRDYHFLVVLDRHHTTGVHRNETVDFEYASRVQATATKHIARAFERLGCGGQISMLVHVRLGDPAKEILGLAEELGASLVIVGCHGRTGVSRLLHGSVSELVVREARCPVLVARDRNYEDVPREKVVAFEHEHEDFVPAHRYHYDSGVPTRSTPWALY